ncbi:putative permease [Prochlorococcus marinus str. MIT 9321]|uniref:Putative permease n=1 Tax=Prochlorococcus marinus str. MIT 9401 TaxID=167551 RepID=A0A0A2B8H9_PROMR|nr:LptF/LptG family permease [Prochlorococcus marinus]KGG02678.1 putative permease [Prochlorococcus marinus str. MIT 9321]KGG05313.1 putative permease [Prochlorococcus marinus str. MIT 9322]KGG10373.1 putative permease [Prochlorococcus marinus str. MIT 9401]
MNLSNRSLIKKNIKKIFAPWYSIPLIDRWLLGQLVPPMIFAISAFTVISLSVGVMFDLIRKIVEYGLPILQALQALIYSLPSFLVLSFPMAVLLSTLLSYGKLSANSELLALKSLGITNSRIIAPAIAVSIFMTGLTFYFNDNLVPTSNKLAESTLRSGIGSSFNKGKNKNNIIFTRKGSRITSNKNKPTKVNTYLTHIFYASRFENNLMKEVTVLDFSRENIKQILTANSAKFNKDNSSWIFSDGSIVSTDSLGQTTNIKFNQYIYPFVEGPLDLAKVPKDARDMSLKEAFEAEQIYKKIGNLKEIRKIQVRIQEKFTLPCACLVFGLIGSILGSQSNLRSSKSQGFGLSVILILFYYIISFISSSFGVKGLLPPVIAAWFPVIISILGGIYFLRKSSSI